MNVLYLIEIVIYLYSFNFLLDIRMLPYVSNFYLFCIRIPIFESRFICGKKEINVQPTSLSVWLHYFCLTVCSFEVD